MKKLTPFDFVNSVNMSKKNLMKDEPDAEGQYVPFVVNRTLSYFSDTVLFANEMNRLHHIDSKMQYDFLLGTVRKRKRFEKWAKKEEDPDIDVIKEFYGVSRARAEDYSRLLTPDHIAQMRLELYRGGLK